MQRRRRLLRWLRVGGLVLLSGCAGCVGRVVPPEPHTLVQPVDVYLLDHGRHASLVLPHEEGGVVRYSYGDWRWYVAEERRFAVGAAAMLWPTEAGLGRGLYPQVDSSQDFERLAPEGLIAVYPLRAEASRVWALQRRLDAYFDAAEGEPVFNETYGLEFVPYPRRYSAFHQSNLKVASWLRGLGSEVTGSPWLSNWELMSQ